MGYYAFDNNLVTMKLRGADLKRVMEHGIMNKNVGGIQFYGLKVCYDSTKEYGNSNFLYEFTRWY